MTDETPSPADLVRGLIDERERFAGWLAALEARRGSTPAHVFDRVHTDYASRLSAANDRISDELLPLRDTESALARRQDELVRGLADRQDELAELELRTLVGEFAADDGERRVQQTAAIVRELDAERRTVSEQLADLRDLFARAEGHEASSRPPAPTEAPEPVVASAPVAHHDPTDANDIPLIHEEPVVPAEAPATVDEEEPFVGTGPRLDALAASFSAPVAATPPAGAGQERTLRCQECGEMNYPTEWYCERCGGELAVL